MVCMPVNVSSLCSIGMCMHISHASKFKLYRALWIQDHSLSLPESGHRSSQLHAHSMHSDQIHVVCHCTFAISPSRVHVLELYWLIDQSCGNNKSKCTIESLFWRKNLRTLAETLPSMRTTVGTYAHPWHSTHTTGNGIVQSTIHT